MKAGPRPLGWARGEKWNEKCRDAALLLRDSHKLPLAESPEQRNQPEQCDCLGTGGVDNAPQLRSQQRRLRPTSQADALPGTRHDIAMLSRQQ